VQSTARIRNPIERRDRARDGERVNRSPLVLSLLAACSYSPPSAPSGADSPDAAVVDPTPDSGDVTTIPPCSAPDPSGLMLCLEFDDNVADGTLYDSSPARLHAAASGLAPAMRDVPAVSPAAKVAPDAVVRVPEHAALDRDAAYTFAVWVRPDALPGEGAVYGLLDHEQQYAMLIGHSVGQPIENRCVHTGVARYEWTENLPAAAWSFLACTWDGTELCAYRWSSPTDHERFCHQPTIAPATTGAHGLAIGHLSDSGGAHSRLDGALDSVLIFDRGLSQDQLCSVIGRPVGCL
jgi:hypothetical protein